MFYTFLKKEVLLAVFIFLILVCAYFWLFVEKKSSETVISFDLYGTSASIETKQAEEVLLALEKVYSEPIDINYHYFSLINQQTGTFESVFSESSNNEKVLNNDVLENKRRLALQHFDKNIFSSYLRLYHQQKKELNKNAHLDVLKIDRNALENIEKEKGEALLLEVNKKFQDLWEKHQKIPVLFINNIEYSGVLDVASISAYLGNVELLEHKNQCYRNSDCKQEDFIGKCHTEKSPFVCEFTLPRVMNLLYLNIETKDFTATQEFWKNELQVLEVNMLSSKQQEQISSFVIDMKKPILAFDKSIESSPLFLSYLEKEYLFPAGSFYLINQTKLPLAD